MDAGQYKYSTGICYTIRRLTARGCLHRDFKSFSLPSLSSSLSSYIAPTALKFLLEFRHWVRRPQYLKLICSDDNRDGHAVKNYYLNLSYGTYEGTLDTDNDIVAFYNVRFALPPLGNLRWRKPVPPTGKKGKVHDGLEGGTCFNAYPDWWGRSVHSKSLRLTVGHR